MGGGAEILELALRIFRALPESFKKITASTRQKLKQIKGIINDAVNAKFKILSTAKPSH